MTPPTWKPRVDWAPQNRAELCACISWLVLEGKLSPEDQAHVAGWLAFRAQKGAQPVNAP